MKTARARARKPPTPLESEVQASIVASLRGLRCEVFRRNVIAVPIPAEGNSARRFVRAGEPGMSDLWGFYPVETRGPAVEVASWNHFEIEAKRPGERPTLDQVLWLRRVNRLTGAAFWADSADAAARVMTHLIAGARIEYLPTTRRYGGTFAVGDEYDIVYPEK